MSTAKDRRSQAAPSLADALPVYDVQFRRVLAETLIGTMMCPALDTPSESRKAVEALAKRIRREVAQARARGVFDAIGATGHA